MSYTVPSKRITKRQAIELLVSRNAGRTFTPAVREGVQFLPAKPSK